MIMVLVSSLSSASSTPSTSSGGAGGGGGGGGGGVYHNEYWVSGTSRGSGTPLDKYRTFRESTIDVVGEKDKVHTE